MRDGSAVRAGTTGDGARRHIVPCHVTTWACCAATKGLSGLARFVLVYRVTPADER